MKVIKAIRDKQYYSRDTIRSEIIWLLDNAGFFIHQNFIVHDRGDGHIGKINIVGVNPVDISGNIAIQIDANTPREKSIFKLRQVDAYRIIVLKQPYNGKLPKGIDEIISVKAGNK